MSRDRYQRGTLEKTGKRNPRWRGHWWPYVIGLDGAERRTHRSKVLGFVSEVSKADAWRALDKLIQRDTSQTPALNNRITLGLFIREVFMPVRERGWEVNTRVNLRSLISVHIEKPFDQWPLIDITKVAVEKHLIAMADRGLGRETLKKVLTYFRAIIEDAIENGFLEKNALRKASLPKTDDEADGRALCVDEVQRLFSLHGKIRLVFKTMILCGLRPSEMLALKREDVQPGELLVDESGSHGKLKETKTGKVRKQPIPPGLEIELRSWLDRVGPEPNALLFPNCKGGLMDRSDARKQYVAKARKLASISDLTFQMCRRTYGTLMKADIRDKQALLGHSDPETTLKHYVKPLTLEQRAAVNELEETLKRKPVQSETGSVASLKKVM